MSKKLVKILKTVLKFTPVAIAVALLIRFATDPLFYLDCVSHGDFFVIALIPIPTIFCYSHPFLKSIILLLGLPLIVRILDIKPKEINELDNGDYYLSTGILTYKFKSGFYSFASSSRLVFSSLQAGYESMSLNPYDDKHRGKMIADTVILRMAYDLPNYMVVHNVNPTREEIQKYMEPVLFVNKVEQPLPIYDTLKLSLDKENKLLRHSHRQVVSVVRKRQDDFLRNLVTIQVNDTLQRTVNLMYKDAPNYQEVFDSLGVGSKLIARVSDINPIAVKVENWQPTPTDIERCGFIIPNLPIASIYSKEKERQYLGNGDVRHTVFSIRLLIGDIVSEKIEILGEKRKEKYEALNEGDRVLIKVDEATNTVAVTDWHPTPEEIKLSSPAQSADSVQSDPYKRIELGYIFKKDSRGITKQFNTMVYFGKEKAKQWKLEMSMFKNINVGDTILLEFSDENEHYCKVISWHPSPEEKEKYRTQVQMIE